MFTGKIYGKWMAAMQREKLEKILEEAGADRFEGKNILDVGSGAGFLDGIIRKKNLGCLLVSCDIDRENLKNAGGLRVLASGDFLPFKKVFDAIFCIDTAHLLDKKRFAAEFAKALKRGGVLAVSAFCNKYNSCGKMKDLEEALCGFEIKKRFFAKAESEWDAVVFCNLK